METEGACNLDPRVKRTREMLLRAFEGLLETKSLQAISVQDIADRSTLNRATFYDHYTDKFALFQDLIGEKFRSAFMARMAERPAQCPHGIRALIETVCDFLAGFPSRCQEFQRQAGPLIESTIRERLREFLVAGALRDCPARDRANAELRATLAAWAICGAATEWQRQQTQSRDDFVDAVLPIVLPIMGIEPAGAPASH